MKYAVLKRIINKYDPIHLLSLGAPEDEYDPEIKSILKRLNNEQNQGEIERIITEEFNYWFGEDIIKGNELAFKKIAREIFKQIGTFHMILR